MRSYVVNLRYASSTRPSGLARTSRRLPRDGAARRQGHARAGDGAAATRRRGVARASGRHGCHLDEPDADVALRLDQRLLARPQAGAAEHRPVDLLRAPGRTRRAGAAPRRRTGPPAGRHGRVRCGDRHAEHASSPTRVVLTKAAADSLYPGQSAVGKVALSSATGNEAWPMRVVGVVERVADDEAQAGATAENTRRSSRWRSTSLIRGWRCALRPGERDRVMAEAESRAAQSASLAPRVINVRSSLEQDRVTALSQRARARLDAGRGQRAAAARHGERHRRHDDAAHRATAQADRRAARAGRAARRHRALLRHRERADHDRRHRRGRRAGGRCSTSCS